MYIRYIDIFLKKQICISECADIFAYKKHDKIPFKWSANVINSFWQHCLIFSKSNLYDGLPGSSSPSLQSTRKLGSFSVDFFTIYLISFIFNYSSLCRYLAPFIKDFHRLSWVVSRIRRNFCLDPAKSGRNETTSSLLLLTIAYSYAYASVL